MNANRTVFSPWLARPVHALLLAFVAGGVWLLLGGIQAGWTDAMTLKTRRELAQASAPPSPVAWLQYRNSLDQAAIANPDDPEFHDYLAYLYASRGYLLHSVNQSTTEYFSIALSHYRASAQLRPASPFAWAGIAIALHYLDQDSKAMWQAFDLAGMYGPNEPAVQTQLAEIGYQRAAELSPARRAFLERTYENAAQRTRATMAGLAKHYGVEPARLSLQPEPTQTQ